MVDSPRTGSFGRLGRVITGWPRLFIAALVAAATLTITVLLGVETVTALLFAWDAGVSVFLLALAWVMTTADTDEIRWRAARQDVGQLVVLALTALASLLSLVAIYAQVSLTAGSGAAVRAWGLMLAVATIALSWFFVNSMFAVHYAHEYYGPVEGKAGGLGFPGGETEPDYWDFIYFAFAIGMMAQTPDVVVTTRRLRRTVLAHGVISFWFNVALLALLINVATDALRLDR